MKIKYGLIGLLLCVLGITGCQTPYNYGSLIDQSDSIKEEFIKGSSKLDRAELNCYVKEFNLSDKEALALLFRNVIKLGSSGSYGYRGNGFFRYITLADGRVMYLTKIATGEGFTIKAEEVAQVPGRAVSTHLYYNEKSGCAQGWSDNWKSGLIYEVVNVFEEEDEMRWMQIVKMIRIPESNPHLPTIEAAQEENGIVYSGKVPEIFMSMLRDIRRDEGAQGSRSDSPVSSKGIKMKLEKIDEMLSDGHISNDEHAKLRKKVINEY